MVDHAAFDALSRHLAARTSRRRSLGALGGALALPALGLTADARKKRRRPCPPCKRRRRGKCKKTLPDGASCGSGGQVCLAGQCTCPDGQRLCGSVCREASLCCTESDCAAGQTCVNGMCANTCTPGATCGTGCVCAASVEGTGLCVGATIACEAFPQECTATAECARPGFFCVQTPCGAPPLFSKRCLGLC